jgi:hypothetical protein
MQTVREWLAQMPPTQFDRPGRGSPGAFDINRDQDVPELKQARAPLPRGNLPPHVTPGEIETGADDLDLDQVVKRLLDACAERDIPISTLSLEEAAEQLLGRAAHERDGAEDEDGEPLDAETVAKVKKHLTGRLGDPAVRQLVDMLESRSSRIDPVPDFVRGNEDYIARRAADWDVHSASDAQENREMLAELEREHDARVGDRRRHVAGDMPETASELMRPRGGLDPGTGERMAARRGGERWWPGRGTPPGSDLPHPAGTPHPPGSLVPGEHHRPLTATDRRMASDANLKSFAKLCGVKRKHLPRSI